jgi:hypothetical protein
MQFGRLSIGRWRAQLFYPFSLRMGREGAAKRGDVDRCSTRDHPRRTSLERCGHHQHHALTGSPGSHGDNLYVPVGAEMGSTLPTVISARSDMMRRGSHAFVPGADGAQAPRPAPFRRRDDYLVHSFRQRSEADSTRCRACAAQLPRGAMGRLRGGPLSAQASVGPGSQLVTAAQARAPAMTMSHTGSLTS